MKPHKNHHCSPIRLAVILTWPACSIFYKFLHFNIRFHCMTKGDRRQHQSTNILKVNSRIPNEYYFTVFATDPSTVPE